ncbi:MAG: PorP/SprF family type IX secretion system membrane protein [Pedobacter sp.]|uniref:PorP/SprF family type IX secretion system membrane protein n=1 Tax=Pedobacter sp. TaxID=1411316 RepID=UPI003569B707
MKKILLLSSILICSISQHIYAQIEMQGSQFIFDKTFINPAFSGIDGHINANLHYQLNEVNQGTGKSHTISASGNIPMPKVKSSLGLNIVRSVFGYDSYTMGYGNYVYHLPVSENTVLSSGISFGVQQFDINVLNSTTIVENDPLAARNIYSSKFDARFGIVGTFSKKYYVGLSFDNILSLYDNKDSYYNQIPNTFRKINMYLIGGATVHNNENITLRSNILVMKTFGGLTALDVNAMVTLNEGLSFGLGFRQQIEELQSVAVGAEGKSFSQSLLRPMLQYAIPTSKKEMIKIGYCYSFNAGRSTSIGMASHDIALTFSIL